MVEGATEDEAKLPKVWLSWQCQLVSGLIAITSAGSRLVNTEKCRKRHTDDIIKKFLPGVGKAWTDSLAVPEEELDDCLAPCPPAHGS